MADTTITITGDARGAVAATVATAEAHVRMATKIAAETVALRTRMEAEWKAIADAAAKRAKEVADAAAKQAKAEREAAIDSVNAWKRADVVGMFKPWFDAREEYLEGAEKVGKAAMAQRVAMLAVGSGAAIMATAVAAAGAAVIGSSVSIIANVDAQTLAMSHHKAELTEGHKAYVGLTAATMAFRVELAGQLAPALTTTFDAMAGGLVAVTDLTRGLGDAAGATELNVAATARWVPVLGALLTSMDVLAKQGRQIREEAEITAKAAADGAAVGARIRAKLRDAQHFDFQAEVAAQTAAQAAADAMMLFTEAKKKATKATATHTAHTDAAAKAAAAAAKAERDRAAALLELRRAMAAASEIQAQWAAEQVSGSKAGMVESQIGGGKLSGAIDWMGAGQSDTAKKSAKESMDAWQSAYGGIVSSAASAVSSIMGLWSGLADGQIAATRDMSGAERQEIRDRWRRQKQAALAQASIQAALGFVTTLASTPYPANIVLAALGAVASGVQIARIANTPPPAVAHTGGAIGLAPDEAQFAVGGKSVRTLQSEVLAVVPSRGGQTDRDVRRMATGEGTDGPERMVYVVMNGRRVGLRQFAGADPGYGRRPA